MCIKEFLGYNCGHCSVPLLRRCPLSSSNPVYPPCKYPAERPTFTNEYCHPCARVVWNAKVLKDEEEHRQSHMRGGCSCEVVFPGEEREKKRSRGGKGKAKAIIDGRNYMWPDIEEFSGIEISTVAPNQTLTRQDMDIRTKLVEYVGYCIRPDQIQLRHPSQTLAATTDGYDLKEQLVMGQMGAGMKWYPYSSSPPTLRMPRHKAPRAPKAMSEPAAGCHDPGPSESGSSDPGLSPSGQKSVEEFTGNQEEQQQQPLVVSSDMARPVSR